MTAPGWLDELDLHAGLPEAAMGTRSLDEDRWLLLDQDWIDQRAQARALLRDRRADVLAPAPAGAALDAAAELGARIDGWLLSRRPALVDDGHLAEADTMAAARARVAEDLCILTRDGDRWLLTAGGVCFPSYWRLRDKIGRPLSEVHEPVPGYPGALASRVDAFLGRLRPGQAVWRRNWSIHDDAALFLPAHAHREDATPVPSGRWVRSEYQTLLRLEESEAVVFTIRTQQVPLAALASRPDRCIEMASALRAWSDGQRTYKGGAVDDALLRWLDEQA